MDTLGLPRRPCASGPGTLAAGGRPSLRSLLLCLLAVGALHWLVLADKPIHIDDPHYVYAAKHVFVEPLVPFGNTINWQQAPGPAYLDNINPPVFVYLLAAWMMVVGESEVGWHLLSLAFVLLATYSAVLVASRFTRHPLWVAAMVMLAPTVLPSVNLMLDMPSLALALAATALWIKGVDEDRLGVAALGGLIAGLAALTKYHALVLLPLLGVYAVLWDRRRFLIALVPAVALMGAWSLHNILVYPGARPHFLMASSYRPFERGASYWWRNLHALGLVLGSSLVFPAVLLMGLRRLLVLTPWLLLGLVVVLATPTLAPWWEHPRYHARTELLWFGLNSVMLLLFALLPLTQHSGERQRGRQWVAANRDTLFLCSWVVVVMGSLFLLAHHQAPRYHWLALLPFVCLLARAAGQLPVPSLRLARGLLWLGLGAQVAVALFVAAADHVHASSARDAPQQLKATIDLADRRVFCVGHWGFQYYCEQAGFVTLDSLKTRLRPGDLVVIPEHSSLENMPRVFRPTPNGRRICAGESLLEDVAELDYPDGTAAVARSKALSSRILAGLHDLWPFSVTDPPDTFLYSVRAPTVPYSWLHAGQSRRWRTGGHIDRYRVAELRCEVDLAKWVGTE